VIPYRSLKLQAMDEDLWSVFRPLEGMLDPLAVIRAAAFLDDAIKSRLGAEVADRPQLSVNPKFQGANTFVKRIRLARSLELFSEEDARDLEIIADLRNRCAHTFKDVDLSAEPFSSLTTRLRAWTFWTDETVRETRATRPDESKARLLLTAAVLATDIVAPHGAIRELTRAERETFWSRIFRSDGGTSEGEDV